MARLEIESDNLNEVLDVVQQFGNRAEEVLNDSLFNDAFPIFRDAITLLTPVGSRPKTHAKYSNPYTYDKKANLVLYIHTKKNFNYLFFPQEAHGCKFIGKSPNDFMLKGVEKEADNVINIMLDRLQQRLFE